MTPDAMGLAIARLEERFDALEAGQEKILRHITALRDGDTEMKVTMARMTAELDRRPTYKEFILWGAGAVTAMIAVAELIIHVAL